MLLDKGGYVPLGSWMVPCAVKNPVLTRPATTWRWELAVWSCVGGRWRGWMYCDDLDVEGSEFEV